MAAFRKLVTEPIEQTSAEVPLHEVDGYGSFMDFGITWVDKAGKESGPPGGNPGEYEVVFTFSRFAWIADEFHIKFHDKLDGDTHLLLPEPPDSSTKLKLTFSRPDGSVLEVWPIRNSKGRLGKVRVELEAKDTDDAKAKAMAWIGSYLSYLSYRKRIPIHIRQIDTKEISTQNRTVSLRLSYPDTPMLTEDVLNTPAGALTGEFNGLYSLYREYLCTENVFYKFLCLYKMLEGLQRLQADSSREARRLGLSTKRPRISLPDTAGLRRKYPNYVGKSFENFYHEILNQKYRDTLAHFNLKVMKGFSRLSPSMDDLADVTEYLILLPIVDNVVRSKLDNELAFRVGILRSRAQRAEQN